MPIFIKQTHLFLRNSFFPGLLNEEPAKYFSIWKTSATLLTCVVTRNKNIKNSLQGPLFLRKKSYIKLEVLLLLHNLSSLETSFSVQAGFLHVFVKDAHKCISRRKWWMIEKVNFWGKNYFGRRFMHLATVASTNIISISRTSVPRCKAVWCAMTEQSSIKSLGWLALWSSFSLPYVQVEGAFMHGKKTEPFTEHSFSLP